MEKLHSNAALTFEAREFAESSFKALRHFSKIIGIILSEAVAFFARPNLIKKSAPGVFEIVEPGPPPGPTPWSSPPGRLF